jgi:hypothetical protein
MSKNPRIDDEPSVPSVVKKLCLPVPPKTPCKNPR